MTPSTIDKALLSNLVLKGDLTGLTNEQKVDYYGKFCERLGLDPLTQPFKILKLQGKEVLYCDRSGAQQLNKLHKVSHEIKSREKADNLYIVTCRASMPDGRFTESIGAVNIEGLKGEALSNMMMKGETKAKRRATLDLLGLGILEEQEMDSALEVEAELQAKSCDDLKHQYLELLTQLETVIGTVPSKMLPDNWKKEQTAENFIKAIEAVKKQLNDERLVRKGLNTPHKVDDINEMARAAADKDDFYVDQRNVK